MRIVWGGAGHQDLNKSLAHWCATKADLPRSFEPPYTTMGVVDGETLIGCVVFNNYQPESGVIEIHSAATSSRWLTKSILKALFQYPFDQLGCQMVLARVSEANTRLLRILTAYGFDHIVISRLRGRDEGERIFWLTDDAWRSNKFNSKTRA